MSDLDEEKRGFKEGDLVRCVKTDWARGFDVFQANVGDTLIVGPRVGDDEDADKYFRACNAFPWCVDCFELLTPETSVSPSLLETGTYYPGPTHAALNAEPDQSRMVGVVWRREPW